MDRFVTDVREIERRIQQSGERVDSNVTLPNKPSGIPEDIEEHIKLMYDLMALAWQTEITRTTTFMMAKELSNAVYPKSGIRDSFHILSHHSNNENSKARFAVLNRYHAGLFAYFLEKLSKVPDGDGTLLDHSLILYGGGMGDGNLHRHADLPCLMAGSLGGAFKTGRHVVNKLDTPMTNLLLTMLDAGGVRIDKLGDSTGRLPIETLSL